MNKSQIKKAVQTAAESHLPKAIREVGRSQAFQKVYEATSEPHPAIHTAPADEGTPPSGDHPSKTRTTVVQSHDPRIAGSHPIPAHESNHE